MRERWRDVERELLPLMQMAYDDLEQWTFDFDPNVERYADLDDQDLLHVLTLRENGVLIGQCLVFITPCLRHKSRIFAQTDHIYIDPAYRKKGKGGQFMQDVTEYVKSLGASVFAVASRQCAPIRWPQEFKALETVFVQEFGL